MKVEVYADADAVANKAAGLIATMARDAVADRGRFVMAVSGGHTPWQMLRALAREDVPWKGVHVVQVDERIAPAGDPDRNFTHLRESLLEHAPLPETQIYAMPVEESDIEAAARRYARTLEQIAGTPPVLDLAHLGLGPDGHTASLVPNDPVLSVIRPGCGGDRHLHGAATHDVDLSDAESFSAHSVAGNRRRESRHVASAARRRSDDPGRPCPRGSSVGDRRPSRHGKIAKEFSCA